MAWPSATSTTTATPTSSITRWRSYALYRNRGDGTFEDITDQAGLGGDRDWPTSAAWADLRQRRRPRPLRLPLPRLGCRASDALPPEDGHRRERAGRARPDVQLLHAASFPGLAGSPLPQRRRPVRRHHRRGGYRRSEWTRSGGRRGRPRRGWADRSFRRQRHDGQLPLAQPGRHEVRGGGCLQRCRLQRRRSLPGRDGNSLRRPRRRPAPRPVRHQFLRRVNNLLPQPRLRRIRRPDRRHRTGRAQPLPARIWHRPARCRQRRPARPGHGQWPRQRRSPRLSLTRCRLCS